MVVRIVKFTVLWIVAYDVRNLNKRISSMVKFWTREITA